MKNIIFLLLVTCSSLFGQQPIYHSPDADLKIGEKYALFGDNVKFRSAPDKKSSVIELLEIGTEVEIVEKTTETLLYNDIESPFYKVRYKGDTGYILAGLISLEKKQANNIAYLFTYAKGETNYNVLVRAIEKNKEITEIPIHLGGNPGFFIQLFDHKGLNGISNIMYINNSAEACGVYGGEFYFFQAESGFKKVFETTIYSDAGVNWFSEKLTFPTDEGGIDDRILYHKEQGEYGDEATNEVHIATTQRELRWENDTLLPAVKVEEQ